MHSTHTQHSTLRVFSCRILKFTCPIPIRRMQRTYISLYTWKAFFRFKLFDHLTIWPPIWCSHAKHRWMPSLTAPPIQHSNFLSYKYYWQYRPIKYWRTTMKLSEFKNLRDTSYLVKFNVSWSDIIQYVYSYGDLRSSNLLGKDFK